MAGHRRLAGNGLEGPLFPEYLDYGGENFFDGVGPALGSSDDAALAETPGWREPLARPLRSTTSPAMRSHNAWLAEGSSPGSKAARRGPGLEDAPSSDGESAEALRGLAGPGELLERDPGDVYPYLDDARWRPPAYLDDYAEMDMVRPSRAMLGSWESNAWLTPRRRGGPSKSDPVRRGAELRNLWNRDRFLRSTASRKFDLRACGPPREASTPRRSRRLFSGYVPPHQKRRDDLRSQVRLQMRDADYY